MVRGLVAADRRRSDANALLRQAFTALTTDSVDRAAAALAIARHLLRTDDTTESGGL